MKTIFRNGKEYHYVKTPSETAEYCYTVFTRINERPFEIIITNIAVEYYDHHADRFTITNLKPRLLLGKLASLSESQIYKIIDTLETTSFEGKSYSSQYAKKLKEKDL